MQSCKVSDKQQEGGGTLPRHAQQSQCAAFHSTTKQGEIRNNSGSYKGKGEVWLHSNQAGQAAAEG